MEMGDFLNSHKTHEQLTNNFKSNGMIKSIIAGNNNTEGRIKN